MVRVADPNDARTRRLAQTSPGRAKADAAVRLVRELDGSFFADAEPGSITRILRDLVP